MVLNISVNLHKPVLGKLMIKIVLKLLLIQPAVQLLIILNLIHAKEIQLTAVTLIIILIFVKKEILLLLMIQTVPL